jgi:hypothetical protein
MRLVVNAVVHVAVCLVEHSIYYLQHSRSMCVLETVEWLQKLHVRHYFCSRACCLSYLLLDTC